MGRVEDEHCAVGRHVMRERAHAGEPGEWKSVEAAHLKWPEHLICPLRVLDAVQIVAADAVGRHDLRGLES